MKIVSCIGLFLLLIGILLFWLIGKSIYDGKYAAIEFVNNSGELLEVVSISVHERTCSASGLLPDGNLKCVFENLTDGSYRIVGETKSGRKFIDNLGYVSGGMNFNDKIVLEKDGVVDFLPGGIKTHNNAN